MTGHEADLDKIDLKQKEFLTALVHWRPDFKKYCETERSKEGIYNLRVNLPSPTGDKERDIFIWIDDGDISIEFGLWHTHGNALLETDERGVFEEYSIIDLIKMIVSNEIVYFIETGSNPPFSGILNLKNKNEIARELTSQYSSGEIDIRSWDATRDRRIALKDLTL